jgi:hypothetical protein
MVKPVLVCLEKKATLEHSTPKLLPNKLIKKRKIVPVENLEIIKDI